MFLEGKCVHVREKIEFSAGMVRAEVKAVYIKGKRVGNPSTYLYLTFIKRKADEESDAEITRVSSKRSCQRLSQLGLKRYFEVNRHRVSYSCNYVGRCMNSTRMVKGITRRRCMVSFWLGRNVTTESGDGSKS